MALRLVLLATVALAVANAAEVSKVGDELRVGAPAPRELPWVGGHEGECSGRCVCMLNKGLGAGPTAFSHKGQEKLSTLKKLCGIHCCTAQEFILPGQTKPCDEFVESFNLPLRSWITRDVCLSHGKDKLTENNVQEKNPYLHRKDRKKSKKVKKKWRLVRIGDIESANRRHVRVGYSTARRDGGLVIRAQARSFGCGRSDPSGLITYIKGSWTKIRYRQKFYGSASCWDIFGSLTRGYLPMADNGLYAFDPKKGDRLRYQNRMRSRNHRLKFDNRPSRCDNRSDNFWHGRNGQNPRYANVVLRRRGGTERAGISTATSCGRPWWKIDRIYVWA